MSFKSLLKAIGRALPTIVANAPAVIGAIKEVKQAVRTPPKTAANDPAPAPAKAANDAARDATTAAGERRGASAA